MNGNCRKQKVEIGSNPNPNLNPDPDTKSSGITKEQISKFRELQRRRLQIASKSKFKKNKEHSSDVKDKILNEDGATGSIHENMDQSLKDSSIGCSSKNDDMDEMSSVCTQADVHPAFRKKKLHWGLDTKERWERKANM